MKEDILKSANESVQAIRLLTKADAIEFIEAVTGAICQCFSNKGKVLIAGNGGSLCDAVHFAEELTGIFRGQRQALPAIALSEPGHISCIANDLGYEFVFSRYVEALGCSSDILIVLTTSGNSRNLINAVEMAKKIGMKTVAFLGRGGGKLKGICDFEWIINGFPFSDRVQEAHMAALHIIVEMIEKTLFSTPVESPDAVATQG